MLTMQTVSLRLQCKYFTSIQHSMCKKLMEEHRSKAVWNLLIILVRLTKTVHIYYDGVYFNYLSMQATTHFQQ